VATSGAASVGSKLSRDELAAQRETEVAAACVVLGVSRPRFLRYEDGALDSHLEALTASLQVLVDEIRPDAVFAPWALDGHADHRAAATALAACKLPASSEIWNYEVWAPLPANRLVDVTPSWHQKTEALESHRSAFSGFDALAFLSLQRWRSIFLLGGTGFAEAFLVLGPSASASISLVSQSVHGAKSLAPLAGSVVSAIASASEDSNAVAI
jgi:LmbE family N-acetylglucosaminyl deacetylase